MPTPSLPPIGLGTLRNTDPEECAETIVEAVDVGYRHIDTAQKYGNEAYVGDGIARADIPREDLFVATKVDETNLAYDDVLRTTEESRELLGIDTIDLHYIHWPAVSGHEDRYDPEETIPAFNELLDEGVIDRVGVGNFDVALVEEAQDLLDVPIFAIQVEMHPLLQQRELVEYAQDNDVYLVSYCPLMRGDIVDVPEIVEIAEARDVTPAQVGLAWLISKDNVVTIPKGRGAHLAENFQAQDVELMSADIEKIDSIDREHRIV
ncbi:MAG: aldo/keto reductase, partial [Halobacteriales archaeon]|nr:aldo/keto reductase [Halobacteriales archaeon]